MNKQEIIKRLNADEDRCKYCNYSTISAGDIYCNQGFSHDMDCEGKEFAVDFNIGVIVSSNHTTKGWIPVSERLPQELSQRVLVTLQNQMVLEVWFISGKFKFHETMYGGGLNPVTEFNPVIAWQPLPEPYKEVSHE